MQRIAITAKATSPAALDYARHVGEELTQRGFSVIWDDITAHALGADLRSCPKAELAAAADLLITFGGDGTLLSVARHAPEHVPILGVNMGTLGFLTEIRVEEFPEMLERVLAGEHFVEPRVTFDVSIRGPQRDESARYRVLNDVVINKGAVARIIEMKVTVAGNFVSIFRGDGLIVSTPTGSTAYNLSAGGPIIYPTMSAVVLTPICPHMLTNRPIVLPDELDVEIAITRDVEGHDIYLTMDGQEGTAVTPEDRICVRKSPHPILIVQSADKNYFDVLRNKLKWGEA
jgi:NAD+ kinase